MDLVKSLLNFLKKKGTPEEQSTPDGLCSVCWGYEEYISRYFVAIFIMLLPFSMIPELMTASGGGFWLSIPITALIGWVYVMMEIVGDYTENPFQGMANDIPMLSLCRVIEIDLREMLGETELPPAVAAKNGVLM